MAHPDRAGRGGQPAQRRALGHGDRRALAVPAQAHRPGSGQLFGAVRRDPRRCHRLGDLFLGRARRLARHAVVIS